MTGQQFFEVVHRCADRTNVNDDAINPRGVEFAVNE